MSEAPGVPTATEPPAVLAVLTTVDRRSEAERLAGGAVQRRLAACAQISAPITSVYRWQDEVHSDEEWQVLFKTAATRYAALEDYLRQDHPYDTPEIIATEVVRGSAAYLSWVLTECRPEA